VKVVEKDHLSDWPPDRNKTPLFQLQHFQRGAQKPSAPLITDGTGAALTAKLLAVYHSTTFPRGIDNLLSAIESILEDEHGISVDPFVCHDVRVWINTP
jgi:alpha-D-ribose 1-methylphosphonate 5-triphosphate synthase subunit PhnH